MIISKKQLIPFDKGAEKCWFLLIMSFFTSFLLAVLNIYIGYLVIQSFLGDGWSFLGGAFIGTSYVVTIPALVLSIFSVRWIRLDISRKYIFPISISIIGILVGLILQNATELWIYIIIFSIFLLISCFTCTKNKKRDNSGDKATDDSIINDNPASNSDKQLLQKSINSGDNKTFKIVKAFQIVGLVLLFILTLSLIGAVSMPNENNAVNHQFVFYGFIFSFSILILHSIVTIAFFKKKKWALIFKEVESYTLSGLILLLFISFILTEGITLTKNSFITLFIFVFLFLIYGYLIKSYRKLMKSKVFSGLLVVMLIYNFLSPNILLAQDTNNLQELSLLDKNNLNPYVEFISTDIKDFFNPGKSSQYSSINLFDGSFNTCWVAGTSKTDKNSTLYIKLPENIERDKIILNIFSGYGKSRNLYYANARPHKIKISFFAVYNPEGYSTEVAVQYFIKKYPFEKIITLADTFGVQSFPLNLNKIKLLSFIKDHLNECEKNVENNKTKINTGVILKIVISDIYKGTKYDDVCISEIFFNNRFITPFPLKYSEVKDVVIKNNNTLIVDYRNEQEVVIYKDTSTVFTMVDWIENGNFAILHYVPNDAVGIGSRVEEQYHLVDVKNRKIVDNEFKTYTGVSIMFQVLEKDEYGRIYLDNDAFKIELK